MPNSQLFRWLAVVLGLVVIDQTTKLACLQYLSAYESLPVIPFLNFTLAYNKGAAYGMLNDGFVWQRLFLVGLAIIISGILVVWLKRLRANEKVEALAVVLILAGAIGNLIDRIRLSVVVDFIDFYIGDWHWYTFNMADVFISIGAAILILGAMFGKKEAA